MSKLVEVYQKMKQVQEENQVNVKRLEELTTKNQTQNYYEKRRLLFQK